MLYHQLLATREEIITAVKITLLLVPITILLFFTFKKHFQDMKNLMKTLIVVALSATLFACNDEGSEQDGSGDHYKKAQEPARYLGDNVKDTVPTNIHTLN